VVIAVAFKYLRRGAGPAFKRWPAAEGASSDRRTVSEAAVNASN
jgi:hypothetical protein